MQVNNRVFACRFGARLLSILLSLISSVGVVAASKAPDKGSDASTRCPAIASGQALAAANPEALSLLQCRWNTSHILLFGEVHGTNEVPAFIGQLIDAEAGKHPIVLALERTDDEAAAMDAFLASKGTDTDKAALTAIRGWSGAFTDGRSSQAVLDLLDHVRKLRQSGADIRVLLTETMPKDLSVLKEPSSAQRYAEHAMSESIRGAATRKGTRVIALLGSYHLRVSSEGPFGPSIAGQLHDLAPTVVFVDGNGAAWNCVNDKCGPHPVTLGSQTPLSGNEKSRQALGDTAIVVLGFPSMTASAPASKATATP